MAILEIRISNRNAIFSDRMREHNTSETPSGSSVVYIWFFAGEEWWVHGHGTIG